MPCEALAQQGVIPKPGPWNILRSESFGWRGHPLGEPRSPHARKLLAAKDALRRLGAAGRHSKTRALEHPSVRRAPESGNARNRLRLPAA
jgi:hypothetical protein